MKHVRVKKDVEVIGFAIAMPAWVERNRVLGLTLQRAYLLAFPTFLVRDCDIKRVLMS